MIANGNLYNNIMEKLRFAPFLDESNITISVKDNGIVILGGKVKSYTEKELAEEAVEKIRKVRGIANELEVELVSTYKRNDTDIVKAALNALKWKMFVPEEKIKVVVTNGYLTLSGEVEYNYQKEKALEAVKDLYGVVSVNNEIMIKPRVTPIEVKEKIIKEFERNARIDANNIKVEVEGGKVTLKGKVKNFDEGREARNAAWSIPGVNSVLDELQIDYW